MGGAESKLAKERKKDRIVTRLLLQRQHNSYTSDTHTFDH